MLKGALQRAAAVSNSAFVNNLNNFFATIFDADHTCASKLPWILPDLPDRNMLAKFGFRSNVWVIGVCIQTQRAVIIDNR